MRYVHWDFGLLLENANPSVATFNFLNLLFFQFFTVNLVDHHYKANFFKPFAGFKYNWSKLFNIRFWWGMDPYEDEDKKLGFRWRTQDMFKPSMEDVVKLAQDVGYGADMANAVIETERRFDRESIFALQAELRF